jgi:hypothetical protein
VGGWVVGFQAIVWFCKKLSELFPTWLYNFMCSCSTSSSAFNIGCPLNLVIVWRCAIGVAHSGFNLHFLDY